MALYRSIGVVLTANSRGLTSGLRAATGEVQGFARSVESANARVAKSGAAFTALKASVLVAAGALAYSADQAVKFDSSMRNVNSLLQVNEVQFKNMEKAVLSMSKTVPQSADQLAKGLYDIASSGFQGQSALTVLKASAVAATAGLSDTATAVRAIAAVLNAYGLSAAHATDVSDALFQTVNLGIVTFPELATNLGDVIAPAAAAHVQIGEVGSAIAAMTLAGVTGAESVTSLARLIQHIVKPSADLAATFKSMGYESGQAALDALGLHGVMEKLRVSTGANVETTYNLFKDVRAARGALALYAAQGANYNRVFASIGTTNTRAGATQRAYSQQVKSAQVQLKLLGNDLNAAAIELGLHLIPGLVSGAKGLRSFGDGIQPVLTGMLPMVQLLGELTKGMAELGGGALKGVGQGFAALPAPIQEAVLAMFAFTALRPRLSVMVGEGTRIGNLVSGFKALTPAVRQAAAAEEEFAKWSAGRTGTGFTAASSLGNAAKEAAPKVGLLTRAGSGLLGVLGGPWGLALTGAVVGLSMFASAHAQAKQAEEDLTAAVEADSGAIGKNTQAQLVNNLQKSGAFDQAKKLGISIGLVTQAALGSAPALKELNAELDAWDASHPLRGQGDVGRIDATSNLRSLVNGTNSDLKKAEGTAKTYSTAMNAASAAVSGTGKVALVSAVNQDPFKMALDAVNSAANSAANGVASYTDKLNAANQPALDARAAARAYAQSLDDAHAALKKNGATLSNVTQKGRDNAAALDAIAAAALKNAAAQIANNVDENKVADALKRQHNNLYAVARQFGMSKAAAHAYVRQVLDVPATALTTVELKNLAAVEARLERFRAYLASQPILAQVLITTSIQQGLTAKGGGLPYAPGVGTVKPGGSGSTGGNVRGPGTSHSDSIITALSDGEYVSTAESTGRNEAALRAGNAGATLGIAHFATGGKVSASQAAEDRRANARLRVTASGRGDGSLTISFDSSSAVGGAQDYYNNRAQAAAQLKANLTKNPNDSADDFYKAPILSAKNFTSVLNAQVKTATTWGSQLTKIGKTTGGDVAASLEAMGEQGQAAVAAMSKASVADMTKMANALRALDFAKFTSSTAAEASGRAAFQANLILLVKMGQAGIANDLAQLGYEQGGTLAAAAVKASSSQLGALAANIKSIAGSSDTGITEAIQIAAAIQASGGKLGVMGIAAATGLDIGQVLSDLSTYNGTVFSKLSASDMRQVLIDQGLISSGKQPSGLMNSGIVTGTNTGLYYRWAEQGSGGESLIAHNPNRRNRAVWEETGRILGMAPGGGSRSNTTHISIEAPITVQVDRAGASPDEIADAVEVAVDSALGHVVTRYRAGSV